MMVLRVSCAHSIPDPVNFCIVGGDHFEDEPVLNTEMCADNCLCANYAEYGKRSAAVD